MTKVNGLKNAIMEVTNILNGSVVNMLSYCHTITHSEKVTLDEKFSQDLLVHGLVRLTGHIQGH